MKCDSRASLLVCTIASLYLGHEPKVKVATITLNLEDQNNALIKTRISYGLFVSVPEGDGIPLTLLYCIDATFASWACHHVKTS